MYLLYESYYGDIITDCGESTNIIGLYETKKQAIEKAKKMIENELMNDSYVLDNERKDLENDLFVRFFFNCQENWNCYYEIIIQKIELESECE